MQPIHRTENVLLILVGPSSHTKNTKVIDKARVNNVVIISLLSHSTHRLQPLDVSVFEGVNANYNREVQIWLRQHPGRSVTEFQIATLLGSAYTKAATLSNAVSGFQKCGIHPRNPHVFSDDDFVAAVVTDKPDPIYSRIVRLVVTCLTHSRILRLLVTCLNHSRMLRLLVACLIHNHQRLFST